MKTIGSIFLYAAVGCAAVVIVAGVTAAASAAFAADAAPLAYGLFAVTLFGSGALCCLPSHGRSVPRVG